MDLTIWFGFVLVSSLILLTPGVTVTYIVSQSLAHGKKASLPLSTGAVIGDAVGLVASVTGVGALLIAYPDLVNVIKVVGSVYLVYLGVSSLLSKSDTSQISKADSQYKPKALFKSAFLITVFNPKGILFFSAFFPQFIVKDQSYAAQASILGLTFIVLAACVCYGYTSVFSVIQNRPFMVMFREKFHYISGVVLVLLGVFSALS